MVLTAIEIVAYRSVINQKIIINEKCIGFIGKNESGKSNILNAIRLLENVFETTEKDKSKINNELPKVRYLFALTDTEAQEALTIATKAIDLILSVPVNNVIKHFKFINYVAIRLLSKDKDLFKKFKQYNCNYELEIDGTLLKQKDDVPIPPEIEVSIAEVNHKLAALTLVSKDIIPEEHLGYYEQIDIEYFRKIVSNALSVEFEKRLSRVVYWEYDIKYLLPSEITFEQFTLNNTPYDNSVPLFNIFMLSRRLNIEGEEDLIGRIKEWKTDSSKRRKDSHIITEDINKYIGNIWQDYDQHLTVALEETKITVHINDPKSDISNFYEMNQRSQGFKTFISFILTIAAEIEADMLSNCILLLDEPETHLHPSGVKFMKEELLKLSNENNIFYATHSIFMIDRKNLKRHHIVKKHREITKIIPVERNNIIQESVIYEALGTAVDEFSIRNKNIIFEGEMDLMLFNAFMNKCVPQKENLLSEYECYDAGGTRNINTFFKEKVIPKESTWVLILDFDTPGKNLKNDIERHSPTLKNIEYKYYSDKDGWELEDLLPPNHIEKAIISCGEKMKINVLYPFKREMTKTVSQSIEEYKNRNKIENKALYEELYKSELLAIIQSTLDTIKDSSIPKRRESFKSLFPEYCNFILMFLSEKGINFKTEN